MKKLLSTMLACIMLLAIAVAAVPAADTASADGINLLNVSTKDIDGNSFSGSVFADYDLTLLNIWATWCGPCKGEMPDLERFYKVVSSRGVNVVGLLVDYDNVSGAQAVRDENKLTYKTIVPGSDKNLLELTKANAIPVTSYIDNKGNLLDQYNHVGSQSYLDFLNHTVAVMYWTYGSEELTDLAPLPAPTASPTPAFDVTWKFDDTTGTLTVSGQYMPDYGSTKNKAPWLTNAANVKHIIIEKGMTNIGSYAFMGMPNIVSVSYPTTIKYFGASAFYKSTLDELVIPEGVIQLDNQAYTYAKRISIPSTLTKLSTKPVVLNPFTYCAKVQSISVAEGNPILCSVDGVMYTKDMKTLVAYPSAATATEYKTAPQTENLAGWAFYSNSKLNSLSMGANLSKIYNYAISQLSALKQIYFYGDCPELVSGYTIFSNSKLTKIYYIEGTKGWEKTFAGITTETFEPEGVKLGDVNEDGNITQTDALVMLRYLQGWNVTINAKASDINGSGTVEFIDALLLLRHLQGWTVEQFA